MSDNPRGNAQHLSMHSALKSLTDALDVQKKFRVDFISRLQIYKQKISEIFQRLSQKELEVKKLMSEISALKIENKNYADENKVLIQNQRLMETTINAACIDFQDNAQYIAEATRNAIPSGSPVVLSSKSKEQSAEFSVSLKQRPTSMATPVQASKNRLPEDPLAKVIMPAAPYDDNLSVSGGFKSTGMAEAVNKKQSIAMDAISSLDSDVEVIDGLEAEIDALFASRGMENSAMSNLGDGNISSASV